MSPELQKVLNDSLVVLLPILVAVVSAWFTGWKNRKDTNAAFKKIRAHEEFLNIETKIDKGEVHVVSRSSGQIVHSGDAKRLDQKEGA